MPAKIPIDWDQFDKLCHIQCSLREIASWFDCSVDTIERAVIRDKGMKFAEYFEQKRGRGKVALRRKMFDIAMSGDKTLLIWLSKQYLSMSDKQEVKQETSTEKLVINFKEVKDDLKKRFETESTEEDSNSP